MVLFTKKHQFTFYMYHLLKFQFWQCSMLFLLEWRSKLTWFPLHAIVLNQLWLGQYILCHCGRRMLKHLRDKKVSWWFKPVTSYFELSFVEQLFTPKMTSTIAFVEAKSFTTKIFNISHIQMNILKRSNGFYL